MSEEILPGGRTDGAVRIGDIVHKQAAPWTPTWRPDWRRTPWRSAIERAWDQFLTYLSQCQYFCSDVIGPWLRLVHHAFLEVLSYLSYELFEKRFLRLKRLFETAKEPAPQRSPVVGAGP